MNFFFREMEQSNNPKSSKHFKIASESPNDLSEGSRVCKVLYRSVRNVNEDKKQDPPVYLLPLKVFNVFYSEAEKDEENDFFPRGEQKTHRRKLILLRTEEIFSSECYDESVEGEEYEEELNEEAGHGYLFTILRIPSHKKISKKFSYLFFRYAISVILISFLRLFLLV